MTLFLCLLETAKAGVTCYDDDRKRTGQAHLDVNNRPTTQYPWDD